MTLKTWSRGKSKPIKNVVGLFVMTTNPKMFRYRYEVVLCFGKHDYCRIPLQNTEPSKTVVSSRFRFALPLQNPTTVLLTAKAVGVELNLKHLDLMKGEHLTPEFLKINPQHTIPTLVDNGLALSESRAIITYLVSQYGKDDSLYPKDPRKRAVVDQRLYFDAGTLYARYAENYYPHYFAGVPFDSTKMEKLMDAFKVLNSFLDNSIYAAGDKMTVADLSLVASVSTAEVSGIDINAYPNIAKWYKNIQKTAPGYEETNGKGVAQFKQLVEHLTKKK